MIRPRMNGSSTALAQITKATANAALMAKKTTRGRVQPPEGRPIGGVFKLTGLDTKPPNHRHNVDVPHKQACTKANEPESATFVAHPGSAVSLCFGAPAPKRFVRLSLARSSMSGTRLSRRGPQFTRRPRAAAGAGLRRLCGPRAC